MAAILFWVSRRLRQQMDLNVAFGDLEIYFHDWENVLYFLSKYQLNDTQVMQRQLPFPKQVVDSYITPLQFKLDCMESHRTYS